MLSFFQLDLREACGKVCTLVSLDPIEVEEEGILWHSKLPRLEVKELVEVLIVTLPEPHDLPPIRTWGTFDPKVGLFL